MRFKDLEWKDVVSDNMIVSSYCIINLCAWIKFTFCINYESEEDQYYLYSYGNDKINKLSPEKCSSIESAKNVAYRIYSNELERIKKAVDYLVAT